MNKKEPEVRLPDRYESPSKKFAWNLKQLLDKSRTNPTNL